MSIDFDTPKTVVLREGIACVTCVWWVCVHALAKQMSHNPLCVNSQHLSWGEFYWGSGEFEKIAGEFLQRFFSQIFRPCFSSASGLPKK